ncbi:hypothetical protein AB0I02_18725 [Streptomyces phaeochromogenes]
MVGIAPGAGADRILPDAPRADQVREAVGKRESAGGTIVGRYQRYQRYQR